MPPSMSMAENIVITEKRHYFREQRQKKSHIPKHIRTIETCIGRNYG